MYTRDSDARTIADEVMDEGAARGHVLIDCAYKQQILIYLAAHGSAETLDGWIQTVREYRHRASEYTMAFIACHKYLRDLFPADVIEEFEEIGCRDMVGNHLINYVLAGRQILRPEVENLLRPLSPAVYDAFNAEVAPWSSLIEDF